LAGMTSQCWARSEVNIVAIWALSANHAYLMADVERVKTAGSLMNKGRYIYAFRRGGPSWQMCGVTDVQDPFLGPENLAKG